MSAFPVELDEDTTGCPTTVSVDSALGVGEGVGAADSEDDAGTLASLEAGAAASLAGAAESDSEGRGAPELGGLGCQFSMHGRSFELTMIDSPQCNRFRCLLSSANTYARL